MGAAMPHDLTQSTLVAASMGRVLVWINGVVDR